MARREQGACARRQWEIVQGLSINEFSREKIDKSVAELKEEKSLVAELIGN
jgi:malate dehydrogenase